VLPELLAARDARYDLRRRSAGATPSILEVALNVPGWPKVSGDLRAVFDWALGEVERSTGATRLHEAEDAAGYFALYTSVAPARELKIEAVAIEGRAPWGRLLDIDCYEASQKASRRSVGLPERSCFLCAAPHETCIGEQSHDQVALREIVDGLAACAARALRAARKEDESR
jgi:holo-ACP synthase CitX